MSFLGMRSSEIADREAVVPGVYELEITSAKMKDSKPNEETGTFHRMCTLSFNIVSVERAKSVFFNLIQPNLDDTPKAVQFFEEMYRNFILAFGLEDLEQSLDGLSQEDAEETFCAGCIDQRGFAVLKLTSDDAGERNEISSFLRKKS